MSAEPERTGTVSEGELHALLGQDAAREEEIDAMLGGTRYGNPEVSILLQPVALLRTMGSEARCMLWAGFHPDATGRIIRLDSKAAAMGDSAAALAHAAGGRPVERLVAPRKLSASGAAELGADLAAKAGTGEGAATRALVSEYLALRAQYFDRIEDLRTGKPARKKGNGHPNGSKENGAVPGIAGLLAEDRHAERQVERAMERAFLGELTEEDEADMLGLERRMETAGDTAAFLAMLCDQSKEAKARYHTRRLPRKSAMHAAQDLSGTMGRDMKEVARKRLFDLVELRTDYAARLLAMLRSLS